MTLKKRLQRTLELRKKSSADLNSPVCIDTLDPTGKFSSGRYIGAPRNGIPRDANDAATDTIPVSALALFSELLFQLPPF